jgi:predicted Rdx family selenoprotein
VAEINGTTHTAEMAGGEKSQFDVLVDDQLVFSKQREGRWPELSEILAALPDADPT